MFHTENRWMNLLSWCHSVLLCSGFYLLVSGIFGLNELESLLVLANSLWLFIPVIGSWIFIRKVKGFFTYLLAGLVVIAVTAFLSQNVLTLLFSIIIFVIRAYVRIIQGKMNDPDLPGQVKEVELWEIPTLLDVPEAYYWIEFIVLYFAIIFLKQNHLLKWMFLLLFAEIFITYIYSSFSRMKKYVVNNCHIAHLPVKMMQRMQRAVLGITVVLLVVFVLPSVFYGKEPLTALSNIDLNFELNILEDEMQEMPVMPDPGKAMQEMFGVEEQEPNVVLEAILNGIIYIIAGIVGIGILYAVWYMCRKMMNSFEKGQELDEIISLDDAGESLAVRFRRSHNRTEYHSFRQKIRREYKKLIRKNVKEKTKGNPVGWETPMELEEKAGMTPDEVSNVLHEIYERARYSEKACYEDDLNILIEYRKQRKNKDEK